MNKIWQIFFIVLFVFVVSSPLSYADDMDLDEAKKLSDKYLSYILIQDYDQCYSMMDPITRKKVSRDALKDLFMKIENSFGKITSFEYSEAGKGQWFFLEGEEFPFMNFTYMGKINGKDTTVKVQCGVVLIENKLWINSYAVFPKTTEQLERLMEGMPSSEEKAQLERLLEEFPSPAPR